VKKVELIEFDGTSEQVRRTETTKKDGDPAEFHEPSTFSGNLAVHVTGVEPTRNQFTLTYQKEEIL
jgi:hypothetical protein